MLLACFMVGAPLAGFIMKGRRKLQRIAFGLMCFMTISGLFGAAEWGLTLHDMPDYRGTARGFHFYFDVILAEALLLGMFLEAPKKFRWVPPGLGLYWLYVGMSLLSIFSALVPLYVWMAAWKAVEVIFIFVAAYNFLRTIEDLHLLLTSFVVTMLWELIAVLKLKYINHLYQIAGTFEHQNALAMYANLIGLVFLGVAVGPKQKRSTLYLVGFLACCWIAECTLSRGGLVALGGGAAMVMVFSLADKITTRRLVVVSALLGVAVLGVAVAYRTIQDRFNATYNADSAMTRTLLNEASRAMLKDHPLGLGWNNYAVAINPPYHYGDVVDNYFKRMGEFSGVDKHKGIVESHYFLLLAETGYQGFVSYLLFIAFFLWLNVRAAFYFRYHILGAVSIGIAVGCVSNYAQSLLERVLTQPRNMMEWLILLALTAKIDSWRRMAVAHRAREKAAAASEKALYRRPVET
ncbi:MAG TPA: O-antigen ligase family protein [Verrucomicrobiae bacterium]|nr:O-antigen ligase family protein [Verrucomicrobiae bacterium]